MIINRNTASGSSMPQINRKLVCLFVCMGLFLSLGYSEVLGKSITCPIDVKEVNETSLSQIYLTKNTKNNFPVAAQAILTAYNSEVGQTDDTPFITAYGDRVGYGVIAANWLPFGTKVVIPELFGKDVFIVKDRMNKRFNDTNKIDI
jgi:hypothetical protein